MKYTHQWIFVFLSSSALLATALPMEMDMDMGTNVIDDDSAAANTTLIPVPHKPHSHHGVPILETNLLPEERLYWESYNTTTFFNLENSNKPALRAHVSLLFMAIYFLYPICLVLNNVKSKWYLQVLTLNLSTVIGSLLSLGVFSNSVPDMYPNNAYTKMSYILFVASIVHYVSALMNFGFNYLSSESDNSTLAAQDNTKFIPLKNFGHSRGSTALSPSSTLYDFNSSSRNSIDFSHRFSASQADATNNHSVHFSDDPESVASEVNDQESHQLIDNPKGFSFPSVKSNTDSILHKILHNSRVQSGLVRSASVSSFIFNLMNYPLFGYLLIYAMTGITVGNMMGQGSKVFNLLAHFIKGGVFFLLGLVSLARYCGCWQSLGFAWNPIALDSSISKRSHPSWLIKFSPMQGLFTMEFMESFLIFFYGSTNVFLEHLANPGGEWAAKDLQHVSIAFMYIGGGLCGLLTEVGLSSWRLQKVKHQSTAESTVFGTPGFSPNPFPAFTIFWTGILMSQHAQASPVSTNIHVQWGYMLSYGAIIRCLTYLVCIFAPVQADAQPVSKEIIGLKIFSSLKPFTELLVSSALLAGGMIFMESTDQCVEALEWRGLTPMFTLNVSVGVVALIMGWEMVLLGWRSWLLKQGN
ncbi:Tvs1 protein [Saccharomycopsis crataegensis]|uniref:Tvs1 protein n=1 Tax=Saccharomycopsis crataegensis TaxID=43959 RepID=A0AAV5QES1_9ASCO|nr:Tvs1 protein [Saccharomycopsis crataegensis]